MLLSHAGGVGVALIAALTSVLVNNLPAASLLGRSQPAPRRAAVGRAEHRPEPLRHWFAGLVPLVQSLPKQRCDTIGR